MHLTVESTPAPLTGLIKELDYACKARKASESRYAEWMLNYELPQLYARDFVATLDNILLRRNAPSELALCTRRVDVLELVGYLTVSCLDKGRNCHGRQDYQAFRASGY